VRPKSCTTSTNSFPFFWLNSPPTTMSSSRKRQSAWATWLKLVDQSPLTSLTNHLSRQSYGSRRIKTLSLLKSKSTLPFSYSRSTARNYPCKPLTSSSVRSLITNMSSRPSGKSSFSLTINRDNREKVRNCSAEVINECIKQIAERH